jgi:sulfur-oxidizing protein SoxY
MAHDTQGLTRRLVLALPGLALLPPARADEAEMRAAMAEFTGGAQAIRGRVSMQIPPLVENGNSVRLSVLVESPMTAADHVRAIAVFNERNPQPHVITARLSHLSGLPMLVTNIRLATSQRLWAVAQMSDGTFWSDSVQVVVTLAACVEG